MLVDTRVLVWYRSGDRRLGENANRAIDEALKADEAMVSAISFWEMGVLIQMGRFELGEDLFDWRREVLNGGLKELQVNEEIALTARLLSFQHGGTADRLIVASSIYSGVTLLAADEMILGWDGPLNRQNAGF